MQSPSVTDDKLASKTLGGYSLHLRHTKDRLKLFLSCEPLENISNDVSGAPIDREALMEFISSVARPDCIHEDVVDDVIDCLREGRIVHNRRVAKGREAANGKNGKVVFLVKALDLDSSADADHFFSVFDNIKPGTLVARIYPPEEGHDGTDVLGNPIAHVKGKEAELAWDDSLKILPASDVQAFDSLVALKTGYLLNKDRHLSVERTLEIEGKSLMKIPEVDFVGSIIVRGDLDAKCHLRAEGDISVDGSISAAVLESVSGAIRISGSVNGTIPQCLYVGSTVHSSAAGWVPKSYIPQLKAASYIESRCIQNTVLSTLGNVTIGERAIDSRIETKSSLLASKARISGCQLVCGKGVEAREIGSISPNEMRISLVLEKVSSSEFLGIVKDIKKHREAIGTLKSFLGPLANHPEELDSLDAPHRDKMKELFTKLSRIEKSLGDLKKERDRFMGKKGLGKTYCVSFVDHIQKGVIIEAGGKRFEVSEEICGPKTIAFSTEDSAFEIVDFVSLED